MRAQKEYEAPRMASVKERRDIMMRSGSGADERPDDSIDIEDVLSPGDKLRRTIKVIAILAGIAAVALVLVFVIVPMIKRNSEVNTVRRSSLTLSIVEEGSDPEVSQILDSYNSKYNPDASGRQQPQQTRHL